MTDQKFHDDSRLHAYIDGELDKSARRDLLVEMEDNEALRERICELRHVKEWVQFSFEDLTAPDQRLNSNSCKPGISVFRLVASVLILVTTFAAGWFGHLTQSKFSPDSNLAANTESSHVILHISQSDVIKFDVLLDKAESILQQYSSQGIQVEVLANSDGLDMLQSSSATYVKRIQAMIAQYNNVRFIACSKGLQRLRDNGIKPILITGVHSDMTAGDHVIQRLQNGWTYIAI